MGWTGPVLVEKSQKSNFGASAGDEKDCALSSQYCGFGGGFCRRFESCEYRLGACPDGCRNREARGRAPSRRPSGAAGSGGPHVYLLRGLLNIFSLGMDDLANKINARGVKATVHNHAEWQSIADEIAAKYKAGNHGPIVLIGHSLGADAVMFMGEYLGKKGVPVALIVPFDGTGSFAASSNVARVMNLTQRDYARMTRGSGFRGELNNIDVTHMGVGHIDIDKSDKLHQMVVTKIVGVVGGGARHAPAEPRFRRRARHDPAAAPASKPSGENAPKPAASSTSGAATAPTAAAFRLPHGPGDGCSDSPGADRRGCSSCGVQRHPHVAASGAAPRQQRRGRKAGDPLLS